MVDSVLCPAENHRAIVDDPFGVRLRHEVGVDRILWGADFPHVESEWPNSRKVLAKRFTGVPEEEQHKMVAGNAIEFFRLNGALSHQRSARLSKDYTCLAPLRGRRRRLRRRL